MTVFYYNEDYNLVFNDPEVFKIKFVKVDLDEWMPIPHEIDAVSCYDLLKE